MYTAFRETRQSVWAFILVGSGLVVGFSQCNQQMPKDTGNKTGEARTVKVAEVPNHLKAMYDGAVAYIEDPRNHIDPSTGEPTAQSFPESVGWTPFSDPCCADGRPVKCAPDGSGAKGYDGGAAWGQQTWKHLKFEIRDPHLYVYKFISDSTRFKAVAKGDPACNGQVEYYWRGGQFQNGVVTGAAEIIKSDSEPGL